MISLSARCRVPAGIAPPRMSVLASAAVALAALAAAPAIASPEGPSAAVAAAPSADGEPCAAGDGCGAEPMRVAESSLLNSMREWRQRGLMSPRREVRRPVVVERRAARRSSRGEQRSANRRERGSRAGAPPATYASGETFTTMCVRTCDGYFFPISFSTTQDRFSADESACQARCPGMEVKLYTYKVMSETSDQLRGLDGTPYTSLTNAFLYKLKGPSRDESCGCKVPVPAVMPAPLPRQDEAETLEAGLPALSAVPLPRWRPDPNALAAIEVAVGAEPAERPIRVVGPAFFPDR